jgi:hypothetical protein
LIEKTSFCDCELCFSLRYKAGYLFACRSYQNPIGSVYHDPGGEDGGWAWAAAAAAPADETGSAAAAGPEGGWSQQRTRLSEEDRAWAGRNLLPYETLSGPLYPFLSIFTVYTTLLQGLNESFIFCQKTAQVQGFFFIYFSIRHR